MFDYLIDRLDGEEFESREEYEQVVKATIENAEMELGRVERWALGMNNDETKEQLNVEIKNKEKIMNERNLVEIPTKEGSFLMDADDYYLMGE